MKRGPFANLDDAIASITESVSSRVIGPMLSEGEAKPGSRWAVVVIQEGTSLNRVHYSGELLQRSASLYERARVFWDHSDSSSRNPRDMAGFIGEARPGHLPDGKVAILGVLVATSRALREQLLEMHEAGAPDLMGLSHTIRPGETERVMLADGPAVRVKSIKAVESVDVVSFPAAGGRIARIAAGSSSPVFETEEGLVMLETKLKKLKESRPDLFAKLGADPTEAQVDALLLEALAAKSDPVTPPAQTTTPDGKGGLSDADRSLLQEARVDRLMLGRTIPDAAKAVIRESLLTMARAGDSETAQKAHLDAQIAVLAKLSEAAPTGSGQPSIEVTKDEATKLMEGLDGFFMDDPKGFRSFREAYIAFTGDKQITGQITEAKGMRRFTRMLEAMDSSSWANVLTTSMNKRLLSDYRAKGGAYSDWGRDWLCTVSPASNFLTMERSQIGGYGNLSTVGEGQPYNDMTSPGDEKTTFAVAKRGGVDAITLEMVINDQVSAIRRIPQNMAMAARRTLVEFVYGLITANPTLDIDSVALFHDDHANKTTSALSASTWKAGRLAMLKQTQKTSGKRLGLIAQHLIVPPDLEETAVNLFRKTTENDPQFIHDTKVAIHVMAHATNATNWFVCAGKDQAEQIEISFLNGQEEPEIVVADNPAAGAMFTNDKQVFKIRHIYGGDVVDFRPFYGGIVS